jgi:hypothetical protein
MKNRFALAAAFATILAVAAWMALRPPQLEPIPGPDAAAAAAARAAERAASAAAQGPSGATPATDPRAGIPRVVMTPPPPTLFNEYLGARQYRILYDRLAGSPEGQTAEGQLVLYEILRQCATITEGRRPGFKARPQNRDEFINSIPASDPQRERRIAAFDAFAEDHCKGFEGVTMRHSELMKLLNDAASAGDPRARALSMEQELWQARRGGRDGGVTLTDAHLEQLRQIAGSGDPEALRVAGRIMANSWQDYSLRIGPDQLPVEQRPLVNAFLVLSCELGAPCGTDTPRMLQACAVQGHCNAQNYPEHLYYYGSTPHDSTLLTQYREILRHAIRTGDWSQLTVVRGAPPPGNRMTFVPGPR